MNKINKIKSVAIASVFSVGILGSSLAQTASTTNLNGREDRPDLNTITTAVPFLLISPDSRSGAMGDAGAATSPDMYSMHHNASKLAFIEDEAGVSISFVPWLKQITNDIFLGYISGYKKIDDMQTISGSLRYFSLGTIQFTDVNNQSLGEASPNEFSLDVGYARKLADNFSGAVALRFINSNLTQGIPNQDVKPGRSVAADVSGFYKSNQFDLNGYNSFLTVGLNLSNIGAKMNYTSTKERDFLPTNLKLGSALNMELDDYNAFSFTLDVNKLLVPTTPIYDNNGDIVSGKDPDVGVAAGVFNSFTDAPGYATYDDNGDFTGIESGSKFKEEMREFNLSGGVEYWYAKKFAIRAGYFHEHYTKGNRKFATFGAGIRFSKFEMDLSYLVSVTQTSPLANTLRVSMQFHFGEPAATSSNSSI